MLRARWAVAGAVSLAGFVLAGFSGCDFKRDESKAAAAPAVAAAPAPADAQASDAPAPESTGGFDGRRAYEHVAKQVGFGPRPSGSEALSRAQDYILSELKSYGCTVETDSFSADTPIGRLPMKNILVKISGEKPGAILLGTHYDTLRMDKFVGADDGGSSTGVMLELARRLCARRGRYAVWIAFFDGEEAMQSWSDTDSRYGSRQMAAKLATSGELGKIRAFLLADLVGSKGLRFKRESSSTPWLTKLVWATAAKLGYGAVFTDDEATFEDDHDSFLKRGVPSADVIRCCTDELPYWHTSQDTLDKISARSLAITGHVFLESVRELEQRGGKN